MITQHAHNRAENEKLSFFTTSFKQTTKYIKQIVSPSTATFGETVYFPRKYSYGSTPVVVTYVLPGIRHVGDSNIKNKKKQRKQENSYIRTDYVPSDIHPTQCSKYISEQIRQEEEMKEKYTEEILHITNLEINLIDIIVDFLK